MENIDFEALLVTAAKLPIVKIDRESFLRKELKNRFNDDIVNLAIEYNPACAGIAVEDINKIAKDCITSETTKVTAISAAAGIPGGLAMIGTVPADLAQYFAHILRILQELIYLYGWQDLQLDKDELNEETKNMLTLFVGIMFGVNGAVNAVNKIAGQVAKQVAKKLPQKALTKGVIYPVVKKVCAILGVKMTKDIFAKGVSKVVPVVGAAVSGGLTYVTYKPMAQKLKVHLAYCKVANVEYCDKLRNEDIVDEEVDDDLEDLSRRMMDEKIEELFTCNNPGENSYATSKNGLGIKKKMCINGSEVLSDIIKFNDGGCVYGIALVLNRAVISPFPYEIEVDAEGPHGAGTGSGYLRFTDKTGDTYSLSITDSRRKKHVVDYSSDDPFIVKVEWSNKRF